MPAAHPGADMKERRCRSLAPVIRLDKIFRGHMIVYAYHGIIDMPGHWHYRARDMRPTAGFTSAFNGPMLTVRR